MSRPEADVPPPRVELRDDGGGEILAVPFGVLVMIGVWLWVLL